MAKYTISYTCGHSSVVNLIGPHHSRERRIAHLESGECFECYKKHATEAAQEQAQELELPALAGTEGRVAWAETLRVQKLTEIESEVGRLERIGGEKYRQALIAVEHISNETSAKQWIEWRYDPPHLIIAEVLRAMMTAPTEEQKQAERKLREQAISIKQAALAEATIRPESPVSEMAAEIRLNGSVVSVKLPERRDDFIRIVKSMGYEYPDGEWQRSIGKFAGTPTDRAVELGHTLLAHRFLVRVFDDVLRARIIAGEFEPEHTRWISKQMKCEYAGWFVIQWGRNEDYYGVARKLKGSKYGSPHVVVPPAQFEQVLDFAQMYEFRLSGGAQEAARQAKEDKDRMLVVKKEAMKLRKKMPPIDDVPPVLAIPTDTDVADELKDD